MRALENIVNKLNYGIISAVDLACDRSLIAKLLEWFNYPSPPKRKECLELLLKLCGVWHVAQLTSLTICQF